MYRRGFGFEEIGFGDVVDFDGVRGGIIIENCEERVFGGWRSGSVMYGTRQVANLRYGGL